MTDATREVVIARVLAVVRELESGRADYPAAWILAADMLLEAAAKLIRGAIDLEDS